MPDQSPLRLLVGGAQRLTEVGIVGGLVTELLALAWWRVAPLVRTTNGGDRVGQPSRTLPGRLLVGCVE